MTMGDMGDIFNAHKSLRKAERAKFGKPCPECVSKLPRAQPSILIPQQVCRIHRYRDPRPALTQDDYDNLEMPE